MFEIRGRNQDEQRKAMFANMRKRHTTSFVHIPVRTYPVRDYSKNYQPIKKENKPAVNWMLVGKRFGYTEDVNEAGYVLPDGRMLDFSYGHKKGGEFHSYNEFLRAVNDEEEKK